jgi:ParB-like chromosome segregation protein Spo0J
LLCAVRGRVQLVAAAILQLLVPSSFAQCARSGSEVSATATKRFSTTLPTSATAAKPTVVMSFAMVKPSFWHYDLPTPQGEGNGRVGFPAPRSFPRVGFWEGEAVRAVEHVESRPLLVSELGERYRRYRLGDPAADEAMGRSLRHFGQASPVTACWRDNRAELLDGFKRKAGALQLGWATLSVRLVEVDECSAKAAIYGLNSIGRHPSELEEAWIVQALVREDGLSQVDAAQLLNKHKSWVCRRLALLEKLSAAVKEELRLALLGPALARQLTRLPVGNQEAVLTVTRRETLTAQEVSGVIDLLLGASEEQAVFVLAQPREALRQARGVPTALRDPRLSPAGNWLARHLTRALEALQRMEHWLRTPGERELTARDRELIEPLLARLGDQASLVAEQVLGPDLRADRRPT